MTKIILKGMIMGTANALQDYRQAGGAECIFYEKRKG